MALEQFSVCDACNRHVKRSSVRCPFCDAVVTAQRSGGAEWCWAGATRATLVAAALAGCERGSPAPAPIVSQNPPEIPTPIVAEPSVPDASAIVAQAASDASLAPAMFGLGYGAPPPEPFLPLRLQGEVTVSEADSESPESGPRVGRVTNVLRSQRGGFRACYQRELRADPTLAGTVSLRFTINGEGHVIAASASGLVSAPAVASCLVARVRRQIFPTATIASEVFVTSIRFDPGP